MKTSDFDFTLPEELIARYPLEQRSDSRLLHLNASGECHHQVFSQLTDLLMPDDVLILNDTRVIAARLFAKKKTGGQAEILVERILTNNFALVHIRSNKSIKLPLLLFLQNNIEVVIHERVDDRFKVEFKCESTIPQILKLIGTLPLPPYMQRTAQELDQERYQTVYGTTEGAIAAPTAGLHFDRQLFDRLSKRGIQTGFITLHVGSGTFKPVQVEALSEHKMHHEYYEIPPAVCTLINQAKVNKRRIVAVGTTTVRALETAFQKNDLLSPCSGETDIFIYPGFRFKCIDALITNFHLPKSTLLMLVCAFGGYEKVMEAYQVAIEHKYRFYSYGDAMLVNRSDYVR